MSHVHVSEGQDKDHWYSTETISQLTSGLMKHFYKKEVTQSTSHQHDRCSISISSLTDITMLT